MANAGFRMPRGSLESTTRASIRAAEHLTNADKGVVAAVLLMASLVDKLSEKPGTPALRLAFRQYLQGCEALGLTPLGRKKLGIKPASSVDAVVTPIEDKRSRLAELRKKNGLDS